ncbi:hypothetical protein D2V17_18930 [Aurantiacibacter xanthus]|uniref:Uncharacterized protein n=1 Tax=Aurantiacibacter xanthus TaxID=1784712 RepID=A0A3A1P1P2_9SPHN|nr:hypothetical protein [Aurantiacibacter xanthus]RIV80964.1 hypothetical protein D2V17_18930 [Aurantiacibacter xanthus]
MRGALLISLGLALASCGQDPDPAEQAAEDKKIVEMVRAANDAPPPIEEVIPQAILYPDIEKADLYGASCAYAPGTSMGARVIAREADAYMKIDGDMVRFAADPGARELAGRTRSLYNGRRFSLRLQIDGEGQEDPNASESTIYQGTIWLRDRWDRNVYTGSGTVSCGV